MLLRNFIKLNCWRSLVTAGQETFPNVKIKPLTDPVTLAEAPYWDKDRQLLYFVDILGKSVNRYDPAKKEHKKLELKDTVSFIIPVKGEDKEFVISLGRRLFRLTWEGRQDHHLRLLTTVIGKDGPCIPTRLNDGKADHLGNIFLGTMAKEDECGNIKPKQGEFYCYSEGCLDTVEVCVSISNGIAWNNDRTRMYYVDSLTRRVDVFDYSAKTGQVCNRRPFFDFNTYQIKGDPDGLTTDCEDNLWIACFGGSKVMRVSGRTGIVLGRVAFPVTNITSVAFGGPGMGTLFVTTARSGLDAEQMKAQPLAGTVFSVEGLGRLCGCLSHPACSVPQGSEIEPCDIPEKKEEDC